MKIHIFLTIGPDRIESGKRMIKSVENLDVLIHVLWRAVGDLGIEQSNLIQHHSGQCSLSQARNLLIRCAITAHAIGPKDIVCFADDDGLWSPRLEIKLKHEFENGVEWLLGCYIEENRRRDKERFPDSSKDSPSLDEVLKIASSLGLYIKAEMLLKSGPFDENLGVGASIPTGEDTEYAVRLWHLHGKSKFNGDIFQYHPYKNSEDPQKLINSTRLLWYLSWKFPNLFFYTARRTMNLILQGQMGFAFLTKVLRDFKLHKNNTTGIGW